MHHCNYNYSIYASYNERRMGVAETIVIALLAYVLLLSLARGQGQSVCELNFGQSLVLERNEDNATCTGWKPHMRCHGVCGSKSIPELKERAVHWKQDCECCQPIGQESRRISVLLNCTDGSTMSINTTFVVPKSCQCTDC